MMMMIIIMMIMMIMMIIMIIIMINMFFFLFSSIERRFRSLFRDDGLNFREMSKCEKHHRSSIMIIMIIIMGCSVE